MDAVSDLDNLNKKNYVFHLKMLFLVWNFTSVHNKELSSCSVLCCYTGIIHRWISIKCMQSWKRVTTAEISVFFYIECGYRSVHFIKKSDDLDNHFIHVHVWMRYTLNVSLVVVVVVFSLYANEASPCNGYFGWRGLGPED